MHTLHNKEANLFHSDNIIRFYISRLVNRGKLKYTSISIYESIYIYVYNIFIINN